jgi:acetyltransferase-like isoleucine patch superfamily enzyme
MPRSPITDRRDELIRASYAAAKVVAGNPARIIRARDGGKVAAI